MCADEWAVSLLVLRRDEAFVSCRARVTPVPILLLCEGPKLLAVLEGIGGFAIQYSGVTELETPDLVGGMLAGHLSGEGVDDDGHGIDGRIMVGVCRWVFFPQFLGAHDP